MRHLIVMFAVLFGGSAIAADPGYVLLGASSQNPAQLPVTIGLCKPGSLCPDHLRFPADGGLFAVPPGTYEVGRVEVRSPDGSGLKTIRLNSPKTVEVRAGAVSLVGMVDLDADARRVRRTVPVALQDAVCDEHAQLIGTSPLYDAFADEPVAYRAMCQTKLTPPPRRDRIITRRDTRL